MLSSCRRAFTVAELLVVVVVLAILIAVLLPVLSAVRQAALKSRLATESEAGRRLDQPPKPGAYQPAAPRPRARVKSIVAEVTLTPKLSVGTAQPESIYEARFKGKVLLERPQGEDGDCELELPLPPQIISLADLAVTAGDKPSEYVVLRDGKLVWRGALAAEPTLLTVEYSAVGKGLYELSVPPGGILDRFQITMTAKGPAVRMLELSLQPTSLVRSSGETSYTWDYQRLLFGQPIRLDVLGIAPIDRLGELTWLGPISVVVFGLLVGLFATALRVQGFDRWMLLLTVGTFAGAYPLMYFAQEFIALGAAMLLSAGIVLAIIGARGVTLMGVWRALIGLVLPAAAILTITLVAAVWPHLQGILLTSEALAFFIAAMLLIPRLRGPAAAAVPTEEVTEAQYEEGNE